MVVPWLGLGTFTAGAHGMAKKKKKKKQVCKENKGIYNFKV